MKNHVQVGTRSCHICCILEVRCLKRLIGVHDWDWALCEVFVEITGPRVGPGAEILLNSSLIAIAVEIWHHTIAPWLLDHPHLWFSFSKQNNCFEYTYVLLVTQLFLYTNKKHDLNTKQTLDQNLNYLIKKSKENWVVGCAPSPMVSRCFSKMRVLHFSIVIMQSHLSFWHLNLPHLWHLLPPENIQISVVKNPSHFPKLYMTSRTLIFYYAQQ